MVAKNWGNDKSTQSLKNSFPSGKAWKLVFPSVDLSLHQEPGSEFPEPMEELKLPLVEKTLPMDIELDRDENGVNLLGIRG